MQHSNLCRAFCAAVVVSLLLTGVAAALPHDGFPDPLLPPIHPNPTIGYYGRDLHAMYPQGVILNNPFHHAFTGVTRMPSGPDEMEYFSSVVDATVDIPPAGMYGLPVTLTGPVHTVVRNYTSGQLGTFDTEILSMDLTGNIGGQPVMIRESPTRQSLGRTTVSQGSNYIIDSFFDVWTELSLDGGITWLPDTNAPGHMELCPEPALLGLLSLAGLTLARRRDWRSELAAIGFARRLTRR
jgi:MYXO-CTERM domain-containing protein